MSCHADVVFDLCHSITQTNIATINPTVKKIFLRVRMKGSKLLFSTLL
jgi:hypothetical protein